MYPFNRMATLLGLGLTLISCSTQSPTTEAIEADFTGVDVAPTARMDSPQALADTDYMAAYYLENKQPHRNSVPLDLSDDRQYRWLKNRLNANGRTAAVAPGLHNAIKQKRLKQLAGLVEDEQPNAGCDGITMSENMGLTEEGVVIRNSAVATCSGGALFTYVDSMAYSYPLEEIDAVQTKTPIVEPTSATQWGVVEIETHNEDTGETDVIQVPAGVGVETSSDGVAPTNVGIYSDSIAVQLKGGDIEISLTTSTNTYEGELVLNEPEDKNGDHLIKMCLDRGDGDCDYYHHGTGDLILPMAGEMWIPPGYEVNLNLGYNGVHIEYTSASIILANESGGLCDPYNPDTDPFFYQHVRVEQDRVHPESGQLQDVVRWNYDANFGQRCSYRDERVILVVTAIVYMQVRDNPEGVMLFAGDTARPPENIWFKYSCFAEGTQIRMADGSLKAIESIRPEDQLMADGKGRTMRVHRVQSGKEKNLMVRIKDDMGHELFVTDGHPIPTAFEGIMRADELALGMALTTENGVSLITDIKREPYHGKVYNVALGTDEEWMGHHFADNTLYAEGILVGDDRMQSQLKKRLGEPVRFTQLYPSLDWQTDYDNDMKRGQGL